MTTSKAYTCPKCGGIDLSVEVPIVYNWDQLADELTPSDTGPVSPADIGEYWTVHCNNPECEYTCLAQDLKCVPAATRKPMRAAYAGMLKAREEKTSLKLVTRSAPGWAWEVIGDVLDEISGGPIGPVYVYPFERREEIRKAYKAMIKTREEEE